MLDHTFVILAYKESAFLEKCIESLKGQTSPSHILLSTSTPSPFLERIAAAYGIPMRVNENREGIAADWNFAYEQASTKYVTLAHQDDVYDASYAHEVVSCAERRPDTLFAFSDYYEIVQDRRRDWTPNLAIKRMLRAMSFLVQRHIATKTRKKALIAFGCPIPCPSVMFNRQLLQDFCFSTEFSINMDWDAWYRITARPGSIACVPKNLLGHRLHAESETTAGICDQRRALEDRRMFARMWPAPIANMFCAVYQLGYRGNSIR